jgi:hypothetical protein
MKKEIIAITYCDFGKAPRQDNMRNHTKYEAIPRYLKQILPIYGKIGRRIWTVDMKTGKTIFDNTVSKDVLLTF